MATPLRGTPAMPGRAKRSAAGHRDHRARAAFRAHLSSLVAKGAFNSLGKLAEWRGLVPGQPRALIVRHNVAANREARRPDVSNLVVSRLAAPTCVVAVVPRGPRQNEKARAIADGRLPTCVKG